MYKCGNLVNIGDCVTIEVTIETEEMNTLPGDIAVVLAMNTKWAGLKNPLLTIKRDNDRIEQIPANWCKLCQRK